MKATEFRTMGSKLERVCYIDNETTKPFRVRRLLKEIAHHVDFFSRPHQAIEAFKKWDYPLVLINTTQEAIDPDQLRVLVADLNKTIAQHNEGETFIAALVDDPATHKLKALAAQGFSAALTLPVEPAQLNKLLSVTNSGNTTSFTLIQESDPASSNQANVSFENSIEPSTPQTSPESIIPQARVEPEPPVPSERIEEAQSRPARTPVAAGEPREYTIEVPTDEIPTTKNSTHRIRIALVLTMIVVSLVAWWLVENPPSEDVTTVVVERGPIEEAIMLDGIVSLQSDFPLYAQAENQIKSILVSSGQRVKKGDTLVVFDDTRAKHDSARSGEALKLLEKDIAKQEDLVARLTKALELGAVAQHNVDDATSQLEKLKAKRQLARSKADGMQGSLDTLRVLAPSDGLITEIKATPGAWVAAREVLLRFADEHDKELRLVVPQDRQGLFQIGQTVTLQAHPQWSGQIAKFNNEENSLRVAVVALGKLSLVLGVGQQLRAQVYLGRSDNALLLPRDAVFRKQERDFVASVERGRIKHISVELGLRNALAVQVLNGVHEGQTILIGTQAPLLEGAEIDLP